MSKVKPRGIGRDLRLMQEAAMLCDEVAARLHGAEAAVAERCAAAIRAKWAALLMRGSDAAEHDAQPMALLEPAPIAPAAPIGSNIISLADRRRG